MNQPIGRWKNIGSKRKARFGWAYWRVRLWRWAAMHGTCKLVDGYPAMTGHYHQLGPILMWCEHD